MTRPAAPTLIDELYRMSFSPKPIMNWRLNTDMRHALHSARRFVVDDNMSAFMSDLANEAFIKHQGTLRILSITDSLKVSSRLPHAAIWIEYKLHAYQIRSHETLHKPLDLDEIPEHEGWLIQQHPKIETACIMHLFTAADHVHTDGNNIWTYPFAFGWTCDGSPLPWHTLIEPTSKVHPSAILVGIPGYRRDHVNCVLSPLIHNPQQKHDLAYRYLLQEWTGIIRRVWALLATIDHLPLTRSAVRQSKGFLARGRIRPFLDHQTITLNIPHRTDTRVLARKAIAIAHRKRHEVRAFWRDDWRHPPVKGCPHIWQIFNDDADTIVCEFCAGRQFYVHKHERGDAALGYVTHDYKVVHEVQS